jgi:hypothetical protein
MSRVVYLHVGAPKTGTTYVQDRLSLNASRLSGHGIHVPTGSRFVTPALFQFRAALDVLGQDWGGAPGHAEGAWSALMRKVDRLQGTVVISHEILAAATSSQVARVMNDLDGGEVHVVYSARDLARQLPSGWQETSKQGRKWSFRRFLNRVERGTPWFAQAVDLPAVLGTWTAHLPPDRVHVVTVPAPTTAAPRQGDLLWLRFCEAFGIDPAWAPLDSERANRSMGIPETQLVRQLNRRLDRAVRREAAYDKLIRDLLAQRELAQNRSLPVRLPPERFGWAEQQAERWVDWLTGSGVHLIGDLEDLRPVRPPPDQVWHNPDRVATKRVLKAALDGLEAMTREAASRPDPEQRLGNQVRARVRRLRAAR